MRSDRQTRLGGIPKHWEIRHLRDGANLGSGAAASFCNDISRNRYPVMGANGVIGSYDKFNIDSGFVIGRVGATGELHQVRQPVWASDNTLLVQLRGGIWIENFLYHCLRNANLGRLATKSAQPLITQTILGEVILPYPPENEQRRIAAILDSIDDTIEATRAVIEQTRRLKTALLQDLLTNGLPGWHGEYQRNPFLGRIPAYWLVKPLGHLCISAIDGPFGSNLKTCHYTEFGTRVVRLQNIGIGEFNDNDKAYVSEEHFAGLIRYEAKIGDLLIASMGDETWPAGRCCEVPEEVQPAMIKADCFRFRVDQQQADRLMVPELSFSQTSH